MGKNATGQEILMLWVSTKSMSQGRKRDLSYVGGELLGLYINTIDLEFDLWLRNTLKPAKKPFLPLPPKSGFDKLGKGVISSCTKTLQAELVNLSLRWACSIKREGDTSTSKDMSFIFEITF